MVSQYRDGVVPEAEVDPLLAEGDGGLDGLPGEVSALIDKAEPSQALEAIWSRVRRLNRYVEETRPFDLAKEEGQAERLDQVLYNLAEGLRVVTLALLPYIPDAADEAAGRAGEDGRELAEFGSRTGEVPVTRIEPLFPKIETAAA